MATGLGVEVVQRGYKVHFTGMDELVGLLKTQEITRSSKARLKRLITSDLVIISVKTKKITACRAVSLSILSISASSDQLMVELLNPGAPNFSRFPGRLLSYSHR